MPSAGGRRRTGLFTHHLSRLTSEGLVVAEPQRGFRAAPISAEELRDITGVRVRRPADGTTGATALPGAAFPRE